MDSPGVQQTQGNRSQEASKHRQFTDEYKHEALRLKQTTGKPIAERERTSKVISFKAFLALDAGSQKLLPIYYTIIKIGQVYLDIEGYSLLDFV